MSDQNVGPKDLTLPRNSARRKVPAAVDRAGDNTPTKPGTEAENAASGTNQTRPDSAQLP